MFIFLSLKRYKNLIKLSSFPYKLSFLSSSFSKATREVCCLFELLTFHAEKLPQTSGLKIVTCISLCPYMPPSRARAHTNEAGMPHHQICHGPDQGAVQNNVLEKIEHVDRDDLGTCMKLLCSKMDFLHRYQHGLCRIHPTRDQSRRTLTGTLCCG